MRLVLRSPRSTPVRAGPGVRGALVLGAAVALAACGHLGIDLGDGGSTVDGLAGAATDGALTGSGGQVVGSGGDASGGASGSGGAPTGGQSGDGGSPASGGAGSSGGSVSSGGETASGGSASGGAEGSGGGASDCSTSEALCGVLLAALMHRYSFDGFGNQVLDSVGGENGTLAGSPLDGSGQVVLDGPFDYVSLPAGLISSLPNVSIEVWFVWYGGPSWQRLFEFGAASGLGSPTSYLYATPQAGGTVLPEIALGAGIRLEDGGGDRQLRTTTVTQPGVLTHVVLVADDVANQIALFKNGTLLAERATEVDLGRIQDQTNQLGRSLFNDDPNFDGSITEFRIYGAVLSADAIAKSYAVGPDATFGP